MVKYNNNTVNKFAMDSTVNKIYVGGNLAYIGVKGESPTPEYQVCFAVVDDITQYSEREFEDVFDKATEKWYKLNNLGEYEEYGVYASGRTSCEGSRLPEGYTEVEYIENTSTSYIDTSFKPNQDTRIMLTAQTVTSQASGKLIGSGSYNRTNAMQFCYEPSSTGSLVVSWGTVAGWTTYSSCIGDYNVHTYDWNKNEFYRDNTLVGSVTYANFQCTDNLGIFRHIQDGDSPSTAAYFKGKIFNLKIFDNGRLVRDFVPCKRDSDDKFGMYDIVNDVFYLSPNNVDFSGGDPITPTDCVTTYKGKLTVDEDSNKNYEYEWNGSSWANLGEVSGDSRLPQGYTEVEYVQNTASGSNTSSTSRLAVAFEDSITNSESAYTYEVVGELTGIDNINAYFDFWGNGYVRLHRLDSGYRYVFESSAFGKYKNGASTPTSGVKYRMKIYQGVSDTYPQFEITDITAGTTSTYSLTSNGSSNNDSTKLGLFHYYNVSDDGAKMTPAKIYEVIVTDREGNELCHSVPCTRDSDGKVGFYNLVRDEFDYDASGELTLIAGPNVGGEEYPKYYVEKDEPLNNLTFNTLAEAEAYAQNNCVYDGLKATINGDRYKFVSDDGWVESGGRLPQGYIEVEYVENTSTAYINTEVLLYDSTTNSYEIETKMSSTWGGGEFEYLLATEGTSDPYTGIELRWNTHYQSGKELQCESVPKNVIYSNIDNGDGTSAITISCSSTNATNNVPLSLFCGIWSSGPWRNGKGKIYDLKITKNNTLVRDLVPCKRDSDEMVGMYDIVSDVFYYPPNYQSYQLIAGPIV